MSEYYKWIAGDDFGKVERVIEQDDEYYYFESKNRCSTELLEDYMIPTSYDDPGIIKNIDMPAAPYIPTNAVQHIEKVNNKKAEDIANFEKIVSISDNIKHSFDILVPDEKTVLIMKMSGIDLHAVMTEVYLEKLNNKISEILNENNNIKE